jgi:hypothetical protein
MVKRSNNIVRLFREQKETCVYCFNAMTLKLDRPNTATVDHVQPQCRGGMREHFNEVAACNTCNNIKSDMNPYNWLQNVGLYESAISRPENIGLADWLRENARKHSAYRKPRNKYRSQFFPSFHST